MGVIDGLQRPVTPAHTGRGDEAVGENGARGWAALPIWRCKSPLCCCLFRRHVVMRHLWIYILKPHVCCCRASAYWPIRFWNLEYHRTFSLQIKPFSACCKPSKPLCSSGCCSATLSYIIEFSILLVSIKGVYLRKIVLRHFSDSCNQPSVTYQPPQHSYIIYRHKKGGLDMGLKGGSGTETLTMKPERLNEPSNN